MIKDINKIKKEIKRAKRIALFTHIAPDCDALGSTFGLYYALKGVGKNVSIFSKQVLSEVNKHLFEEEVINTGDCDPEEFDLFIACDTPAPFRLGDYKDVFVNKENAIVLDHHHNAGLLAKYNFIDETRSSCCEIVYELLKEMKVNIRPTIASKLFTGLSSDTNSFINSNTDLRSFETAIELVKNGADVSKLNELLYRMQTKKEIVFKKYLWNHYEIDGDCAYCLVSYEQLVKMKGKKSDCDAYSSSLISIQGVNYSFSIIEETEGCFSVSMRSKVGYDARAKAEKLGGGGHICAAGAKITAVNIEEALAKVLDAIKKD